VILILSIGFSAYSFMLSSPFKTLDDQYSIVANPLIHDSKHIKDIFTRGYFNDSSYYRPLVNVSFMAEYQVFGLNSFFYNLDNLLLHVLNAFLVWALVSVMTTNSTMGFLVGLLFVLHPIHAEAVANISGRAILLSACFSLSTFIFFILYRQHNKGKFLWLSGIAFILGLLCKESTAVLPGVMVIYLWVKNKSMRGVWPFVVIVVLYVLLRQHLGITQTFPWRCVSEHILGFVTFLRSIITDTGLLIFPLNLHYDRSQRLFLSFNDPEFLTTVFFWLIALIWLMMSYRRIKPMIWFCFVWVALELLPVSQIITTIGISPGIISTADHFLYLASVPFFIIVVDLMMAFWELNKLRQWISLRILKMVAIGFFVFLFLINIEQNIYAGNELAMMERSLQIQPENARLQSNVGLIYASKGQIENAQKHFMAAITGDPWNARYRISFAKTVCDQGRYQECLDLYNQISNPGPFEKLLNENKQVTLRLIQQHAQLLSK